MPGRERSPRRTVIGTVVSDAMAKTIAVRERRKVKHAVYGKYVVRNTVYKAHDEDETAQVGDVVEIAWARRLSKTKFWRLVRVVEAARVVAVTGEEEVAAATAKPAPAAPAAPSSPEVPS
jgi:small subunit ribosomal protein S17